MENKDDKPPNPPIVDDLELQAAIEESHRRRPAHEAAMNAELREKARERDQAPTPEQMLRRRGIIRTIRS